MSSARRSEQAPGSDVPQIDVDRAFAILAWDLPEVLGRAHASSLVLPDAQVNEVVREGAVVGWEKGWTLVRPEAVLARCSIRTLSAFPGRLWLVVDGIPVLEMRREDLRLALYGFGPLVDLAVEAAGGAIAGRRVG